jgi:hypothetical protein
MLPIRGDLVQPTDLPPSFSCRPSLGPLTSKCLLSQHTLSVHRLFSPEGTNHTSSRNPAPSGPLLAEDVGRKSLSPHLRRCLNWLGGSPPGKLEDTDQICFLREDFMKGSKILPHLTPDVQSPIPVKLVRRTYKRSRGISVWLNRSTPIPTCSSHSCGVAFSIL